MTLECPECGFEQETKNWQDCDGGDQKHQAVGMYQVIQWGKYWSGIQAIKNKGIAEEKNIKSSIA